MITGGDGVARDDNPTESPSVKFHYVKSNYFRVIHVDGAIGSFTPKGDIFLSLYNERAPLPDVTVLAIEKNGQLGAEIVEQRKASDGIVRELEVGIAMDSRTAAALRDWLSERLDWLQKLQQDAASTNEVREDAKR